MEIYKENKIGALMVYGVILGALLAGIYFDVGIGRIHEFLLATIICSGLIFGALVRHSVVVEIQEDKVIIYNSLKFWKKKRIYYYKDIIKITTITPSSGFDVMTIESHTYKKYSLSTGLATYKIGESLKEYGVTIEHYKQKGIRWVRDDDKK